LFLFGGAFCIELKQNQNLLRFRYSNKFNPCKVALAVVQGAVSRTMINIAKIINSNKVLCKSEVQNNYLKTLVKYFTC
jgi:hypothetical protein